MDLLSSIVILLSALGTGLLLTLPFLQSSPQSRKPVEMGRKQPSPEIKNEIEQLELDQAAGKIELEEAERIKKEISSVGTSKQRVKKSSGND
jgi:hypothetical protein